MLTTHNARGEHILWLSPMLYTWLATYTSPLQMVVFYTDNKYHLISFIAITFLFIVLMAIPYLFHKYFRENETRNIFVSWLHILSSVVMMIGILMIYTYTQPINRDWKYFPIMHPVLVRWRFFNSFALILFQLFVLNQILFTIYGCYKMYSQRFTNRPKQSSAVINSL